MFEIELEDDLDLNKIADSGQCFRWKRLDDRYYRITAFGRVLYLREKENILQASCTEEEFWKIWGGYLDFPTCYRQIRKRIPEEDRFLTAAADYGKGIRILRQDPFETLITFILSQRKNIPAIQSCVEKLCRVAGDFLGNFDGEDVFSFPTEEQLLRLRCRKCGDQLCSWKEKGEESCSLGYRMPYIRETVRQWTELAGADGQKGPRESLQKLSDENLLNRLMEFKGVGVKVASCTALFGFHRLDFFPVDVWIGRVLKEQYPEGFDRSLYAPFAGVIQQYMFYYYRSGRPDGKSRDQEQK
ncbi:MAG: DNA glycosylase [Lachnospiraceae bacterium]|nr:DNA glycosylase [Lachnospiraceae bacterium]